MKRLKSIINIAIWTIIGSIVAFVVLLQLPAMQRFLGSKVASALSDKLGTEVTVGRIGIGIPNRITIDHVNLLDQPGNPLISATRVSAKVDMMSLLKDKVVVTSAQLFGLDANMYHDPKTGVANYQFVLDSLASDNKEENTPLDLKINSLIIRNGKVRYDSRKITDLSAHVIIDALTEDSLNAKIKRLSFNEVGGLQLKNLKAKIVANRHKATLSNFQLSLPHSVLTVNECSATYRFTDGRLQPASIRYTAEIEPSVIRLSDLKSVVAQLGEFDDDLNIEASMSGTDNSIYVKRLDITSASGDITMAGNGSASNLSADMKWATNIDRLHLDADIIGRITNVLAGNVTLPKELLRLGNIDYTGTLGGRGSDIAMRGSLSTDAGDATLAVGKTRNSFTGRVSTKDFNLQHLLADNRFGTVSTDIDIDGRMLSGKITTVIMKGFVSRFDYNGYPFSNITIDGTLAKNTFNGSLKADDPNAQFELTGKVQLPSPAANTNISAKIRHLNPEALKLSDKWRGTTFSGNIDADIKGSSLSALNGSINVGNFTMTHPANNDADNTKTTETYSLQNLTLTANNDKHMRSLKLESDFASIQIDGKYDYATIAQSIGNLVANKLPTLPGLPKKRTITTNNFTLNATIFKDDFFRHVLNFPVTMTQPVSLDASMNDFTHTLNVQADIPHISYKNATYTNGRINISSPGDTLTADISFNMPHEKGDRTALKISADAAENKLSANIFFDNNGSKPIKGQLTADAQFFETEQGIPTAHIDLHTSDIAINNTVWTVMPGNIIYSENDLLLDHIAIRHDEQHIIVDGHATKNNDDSVVVDLKDVDVAYIMELVNFHSIEFGGLATGKAYLSNVFATPQASAKLRIDSFTFQSGGMGTLYANASLNNEKEQIDIDAVAEESEHARTIIKGYVSPQRNYIDLDVTAQNTSIEFMEGFCNSFMRDVQASAAGNVKIVGDLKHISLLGEAVVNGPLGISPLNTTYVLHNDTVRLLPDRIAFSNDTIFDIEGHHAVVQGNLHHTYLKNMTYDINVEAHNLLAYDFKEFGGSTFCGTVWGSGTCNIKGKSGEVVIDVDVYPEKGSVVTYNAASPDAIKTQEFIEWNSKNIRWQDDNASIEAQQNLNGIVSETQQKHSLATQEKHMATNIHINFLIHATPVSTLQVLMDEATGDHIALNGEGVLRATYYNKGAFNMYGNYLVDYGTYKLTIQNIIKKEFHFQPGGTIAFGGDPYNAALNLKAMYTVNSVSLSDLNIGRSFTSNNIRVNCLMNIVGTPYQPRVEFGLDLPTIGTEAKSMIFSLINSEQEMNQQVLYLLAVGRFYNQGTNNANADGSPQQSQTSLAMQSILSGTISQQLNNVLSSFINNNNWNFGANISTGDEGFNNAEYEGLLSGRLLNNRLLINGEFGYRDNPNATTSFIGDFDIRYLLYPNGNAAIKVYNQTNDRYFTRNSLNTQGVGIILKKDFSGWKDFWGIGRKKKKLKK